MPGALKPCWQALRPVVESRGFEEASDELRARLALAAACVTLADRGFDAVHRHEAALLARLRSGVAGIGGERLPVAPGGTTIALFDIVQSQ